MIQAKRRPCGRRSPGGLVVGAIGAAIGSLIVPDLPRRVEGILQTLVVLADILPKHLVEIAMLPNE